MTFASKRQIEDIEILYYLLFKGFSKAKIKTKNRPILLEYINRNIKHKIDDISQLKRADAKRIIEYSAAFIFLAESKNPEKYISEARAACDKNVLRKNKAATKKD